MIVPPEDTLKGAISHCLSFDLEDWFHFLDIKDSPGIRNWENLPSHVEEMTAGVLDFLDSHQQKATFFILGWVAEHHRKLIRDIANRGHEIGCHSYAHPLIYELSEKEFEGDLVSGLDHIERACGIRPTAYRAPGFSITGSSLWAFDILRKHGITTDSSIFPASRAHGGLPSAPTHPFIVQTPYGEVLELPLSTANCFGFRFVYSGGGYFRAIPGWILNKLFRSATKKHFAIVTYFHPRDFFPNAPIPDLPFFRSLKARVGLRHSFSKLSNLLATVQFSTIADCTESIMKEMTYTYSIQPHGTDYQFIRSAPDEATSADKS